MPELQQQQQQQQQVEEKEEQQKEKQQLNEQQLREQQHVHAIEDKRQVVNKFSKLNFDSEAPEVVIASPRSAKERNHHFVHRYYHHNHHHHQTSSCNEINKMNDLNGRELSTSKSSPKQALTTNHHQRTVDSKWWRSCWNGNQLDGELLYKTIKEQQERRLINQHKLTFHHHHHHHHNHDHHSHNLNHNQSTRINLEKNNSNCNQLIEETNDEQSYVYSVPKFDRLRMEQQQQREKEQQQQHLLDWRSNQANSSSGNSPSSGSSEDAPSSIKSQVLREEDPLSDPLYASILGTSKQLQDINGQLMTARARPRLSSFVEQNNVDTNRKQQQQQMVKEIKFEQKRALNKSEDEEEEEEEELRQVNQQHNDHLYNNLHLEADEASMQLRSLVERCLEVQRATQKSSLLLSGGEQITCNDDGNDDDDEEVKEQEEEDKELEAFAREEEEIKRNQAVVGKETDIEEEEVAKAAFKSSISDKQQQMKLLHINGANKTKSEPHEQSKALLSSEKSELEKEKETTKDETGGQSGESRAEKRSQEQVVSLEATTTTVKAASLKKDLSSNEEQKLVSENGIEMKMKMETENSQVVDWSSDQNTLERLSEEQEEGRDCEKKSASEKSDTCCSFSRSTSQSSTAKSLEKASAADQKVSTTPSLTTASIATTTTETISAAVAAAAATSTESESTTQPAQVSTITKSHDNNSSWNGACAEEASRAAQIDWQSRLSCRLVNSGNNNSLSFEQQQQKQVACNKDENESHEIVIDSNSMSRFEESPIRVRDVESNTTATTTTTKAGQTYSSNKNQMCLNPNLDQNDHKMLITFAALQQQQQQQQQTSEREGEKVSHKLITESEKTNKMDINQQVINEAARRNDLIKFFSHYKGTNWRTKQLAQQIPHQDIKLLTETTTTNMTTNSSKTICKDDSLSSGSSQSGCDEVKFIRNQRKLASQFKASLYYLNPMQSPKVNTSSSSSNWLKNTSSPTSLLLRTTKEAGHEAAKNHHCFKCKLPIKLGSACVRVDNLQVDCSRQQETNDDNRSFVVERCKEKNRKSSQTTATATTSNAISDKSDKQEQQQSGGSSSNNNQESASQMVSNGETEEKSSCDEGLGTGSSGNSSAQSSSAGSHCDDRETPPHVVVAIAIAGRGEETSHHHQQAVSSSPQPPQTPPTMSNNNIQTTHHNQPIHCSNSCDNLKLSLDSLNNTSNISSNNLGSSKNLTKQQQQSKNNKTNKQQRNRSFTLSDDEAEKVANRSIKNQKHDKSRKMRALTWSASLTSFGASFKFGSKGSKTNESSQASKSASENLNDSEDNPNNNDNNDSKTILFHTDCFSCSTCNELLVDLRALIYVSEQAQAIKQQDTINSCNNNNINNIKHDSVDYVNLDGQELMNNERKQPCDDDYLEDFKQQISLYCHRHFVELFKPRCQQCDCLILDEECTEAEGKVWHIKHFCCTECKVPLGGQQYIIVDQTAQQANSEKSGQQLKNNNNNHNLHHHHHSQNSLNLNDSEINSNDSSRNHKSNRNAEQQQTNNTNNNQNSPYCLRCFDRVFGETCEECGKLITCDLGAINHEQRCWHASGSCFKCRACSKSLLGSPFLPSSDGQIYCSIQCCELFKQTDQRQQHQQKKTIHNQQRLSLANYCDPRAPQGALQHQLSLAADSNNKGQLSAAAATQSTQMEVASNLNKLQSTSHKQQLAHSNTDNTAAAAAAAAAAATGAGLLRHKPLIDYLLANARSDEFSHQLLNCLYGQFKLANKQTGDTSREHLAKEQSSCSQTNLEETKLLSQIGNTLEQIESEQKSNQFLQGITGKESSESYNNVAINSIKTTTSCNNNNNNSIQDQQLSARRNKLNPFLIDSYAGINNKRVVAVGNGDTNNNNHSTKQMVMSMVMDGSGEVGESTKAATTTTTALANYINLDLSLTNLPFQQQHQHKLKQQPVDSVDNGSHNIQRMKQPQTQQLKKNNSNGNGNKIFGVQNSNVFPNLNSKASQCSPAVSLVSNEGTISDHSATSSGVSTAPPVSSTNGSLKSHSPLSSTSSHSSVSGASISSSTTGIGSEQHQHQAAHLSSGKQPLRQHINSVSATLERRRRVQPITELSVLDLLSVADDQLSSQQFQQQQQSVSDGFEQLVSHFKGRSNSLLRQQQQFPLKQATCFGAGDHPNNKHQESFFFELAQRLPKNGGVGGGGFARDSNIQINPSLHPLDTNGLPTVESGDSSFASTVSKPTTTASTAARTITDHYSTVNKASKFNAEQAKLPPAGQQQMVSGDNVRDSFFAITSPLLSCKMDQIEEVDLCKSGRRNATNIRPTSSLSVLAPVGDFTAEATAAAAAEQPNNLLHPSLSTGSLNCPNSSLFVRETNQQQQQHGNNSPLLLQPTTSATASLQQQQQQKPTTKAPKSVSFDPTVKDSENSPTGSMTLGRASALKSALKSSSSFQRQHQDFMNFSQSSNTLPASFANQFKAGSLNAYSAYYDEYGRRIKLSSLLQNPGIGFNEMQLPIVNDEERECGGGEEDRKSKSGGGKSILSGALSRLSLTGSQASRGGRREERKLRQQQQQLQIQQQQQQQQLIVQTSQPVGNLANQELFGQPIEAPQGILMQPSQCNMPSTSAGFGQQQQQQQLVEQSNQQQRVKRRHSRSRSRRSSSSSSSRRRRRSSSSSSNHRRRGGGGGGSSSSSSDKRHRGRSSRQSRRQRGSKRLHQKRRSSRYCNDDDCYDSDNSSTCSTCSSTCSSSTSYTNCSSSDSDDESICSSSDRSNCSNDDSYTSDTNSTHSSTSCSSYSSRSSSPIRDRECTRRRRNSSRRRKSSGSRRTEKSGRHKYSRHCC